MKVNTTHIRNLIEDCKSAGFQEYLVSRQRLSSALDFDTILELCDAYDQVRSLESWRNSENVL